MATSAFLGCACWGCVTRELCRTCISIALELGRHVRRLLQIECFVLHVLFVTTRRGVEPRVITYTQRTGRECYSPGAGSKGRLGYHGAWARPQHGRLLHRQPHQPHVQKWDSLRGHSVHRRHWELQHCAPERCAAFGLNLSRYPNAAAVLLFWSYSCFWGFCMLKGVSGALYLMLFRCRASFREEMNVEGTVVFQGLPRCECFVFSWSQRE